MLNQDSNRPSGLSRRLTQSKADRVVFRLKQMEVLPLLIGVTGVLMDSGFTGFAAKPIPGMATVVLVTMSWLTLSRLLSFTMKVSTTGIAGTFLNSGLTAPAIWLVGLGVLQFAADKSSEFRSAELLWTEAMLGATTLLKVLAAFRKLAARTRNSALLLVGSFLIVIFVGTLLLKLPACRATQTDGTVSAPADWNVALFTATSATCVTGLIVEPTGSYWSPVGHAVIFGLFQIGGLGILTFGAFVAVLSGPRGLRFREAKTLRDMLDADTVQSSRRLLVTILLFTAVVELTGAVLLMGLWADLPLPQQCWQAAFHSVSAFCNAGFSLQDEGFLDMGARWQVWGPLSVLIVLGGLGFPVIHDLWSWCGQRFRRRKAHPLFHRVGVRPRLTLHTKLVLWSAAFLLISGALTWFGLESLEADADSSSSRRVADAWFQSVTFRTAGFNTVDHRTMTPASKLLGIFLMFIGAAPGSTGGGVKTVVFAIAVLNIRAVLRGRDRVEVFGRCVPTSQVSRALCMIAIGILIVMVTTGLLVLFERQPQRFIDHLFEATSAFATVGVSAGVTADLTLPSRLVICIVMFFGRVGPVTLLLAMAAPSESPHYDYSEERVSLG